MKKVLIVDDDPDILEAVQIMFSTFGYDTRGVQKGEEAYSQVLTFKPDLILLDYLLSGMIGTEVCVELKADAATRDIPIIMFSAHPDVQDAVNICEARDFIAKPFQIDDMIEKVKRLIGDSE